MAGIRVGYARVSTPEQHPERQTNEMQVDKMYVDIYSGKTRDRPQLQAMLDFIREGDILIVHSLDRLGRNLDDLRDIVLTLVNKGVKVEFITERMIFDKTPSSTGLLMLSILGAFAEFMRNNLNETRMAGIKLAKERGAYKGRKPKFTQEIYRQIEKMAKEGVEKKTIAKYLGIGRTSVYNYLKLKGPAVKRSN